LKTLKIVDFIKTQGSKRRIHPAGYLLLPDCRIAKSGLLQYSNVQCEDGSVVADGELITVYRPPEALKECCNYFNNIPITMEHPEENEVTPETVKKVIVGTTGSNARVQVVDGETYIINDIMIHDQWAIDKLQESDDYDELSAGYETAYRSQEGSKDGQKYRAVQFYLMPNHVALVQNGRCGSSCRVCDSTENKVKGKQTMRKFGKAQAKALDKAQKPTARYRYFLATDEDEENVSEISSEVAKKLEGEGAEVEEMDEKDVKIQEDGEDDDKKVEIPGVDDDDLEDGEEDNDGEVTEEDEAETKEESAEETPEEEAEEMKEGVDEDDTIFEVELEEGKVGKMDQAAYDYCKRFLDMQKKGDSAETAVGKMLSLTAVASKILGSTFAVDSYIGRDGKFDGDAVKRAVIKKQMPGVVTKSLHPQALDSMFNAAVKTSQKKIDSWEHDMQILANDEAPENTSKKSFVQVAKEARLLKLNGGK